MEWKGDYFIRSELDTFLMDFNCVHSLRIALRITLDTGEIFKWENAKLENFHRWFLKYPISIQSKDLIFKLIPDVDLNINQISDHKLND